VLERAGTIAARVGREEGGPGRRGTIARAVVIVLVLGSMVGFVIAQWDRLPEFDWRFEPGWLALAVPCVAAFYLLHAEGWRAIVRGLGERVEGRDGRAVWGESILARYVPTNALMVVVRVLLAERLGIARRVTVASMAYELGIAFSAATIVGAYFVITMPILQDLPVRYGVLLVVPAALVVLHPRVFRPIADAILRKFGRDPLPATLSFTRVAVLLAVYVVSWIAVGTGVFSFASALHPVGPGEYPYVAAAQAVAFGVAVVTLVAPSGLGPRDAALATALAVVLPLTVATAIAIAFRLFQTAVELGFVGVVAAAARRSSRRVAAGRPEPYSSGA
jgi:glycosyltransferase 2 family protein